MTWLQWILSLFARPRPPVPPVPPRPTPAPEPMTVLFDALNEIRIDNGLDPFGADTKLDTLAQSWADTMDANGAMAHGDFEHRFDKVYPNRIGGENIAQGQPDAESVIASWMNSPGHRNNILNPDYAFLGCGRSGGGSYWCTVFSGT
jgi:uncharacterized protein YkwD